MLQRLAEHSQIVSSTWRYKHINTTTTWGAFVGTPIGTHTYTHTLVSGPIRLKTHVHSSVIFKNLSLIMHQYDADAHARNTLKRTHAHFIAGLKEEGPQVSHTGDTIVAPL